MLASNLNLIKTHSNFPPFFYFEEKEEEKLSVHLFTKHLAPYVDLLSIQAKELEEGSKHLYQILKEGVSSSATLTETPLNALYKITFQTADFFFPFIKNDPLEGGNKLVWPSFHISFQKTSKGSSYPKWEVAYTESCVLSSFKDSDKQPSASWEVAKTQIWGQRFLRGNRLNREILDQVKKEGCHGVYLTEPHKEQNELRPGVLTQPWYPSTLECSFLNSTVLLECCESTSKRVGFFLEERLSVVRDLAQTLDYLHKHGIVHRDVKASNIFFSQREGRLVGLLGDCEWLKRGFGYDELGFQATHALWDIGGICNVASPFLDRRALIEILMKVLKVYSLNPVEIGEKCVEMRDQMLKKIGIHNDNPFLNRPKESLETNHKGAVQEFLHEALNSTCYQSTCLILMILEKNGVSYKRAYEKEFREELSFIGWESEEDKERILNELRLDVLQELVEENKELFTHDAVVRTIQEIEQHMKRYSLSTYSIKDIVDFLNRAYPEEGVIRSYWNSQQSGEK